MKDETVPNKDTMLEIDYDILLYEYGFGYESIEEWYLVEMGLENFHKKLFDLFGTYNYRGHLNGVDNFRETTAITHKYKGNRKQAKPKWYNDIREYLLHCYNTQVVDGMESDDGMAIAITSNPNSICCSRDKDLRTVQGWHYCWGTKTTAEKPLEWISKHGYLELQLHNNKRVLKGGGNMFLYAQSLIGDKVDNIVGVKGCGEVGAYDILKDCTTEYELYSAVLDKYLEADMTEERLHENMNLLYMIQELDIDGKPIHWRIPSE